MNSFNRVLIMGQVVETPSLSSSKNRRTYTRLRIATERAWTDANGVSQRITDWHSVFVWGALAEHCKRHVQKDSSVLVEGALAYWREDNGTLTKSAIQAERVHILHARAVDNPESARNPEAVAHPA